MSGLWLRIRRRWVVAGGVLAAVAAATVVVLLATGGGGDGGKSERERRAAAAKELGRAEIGALVDRVLVLGFDGTGPGAIAAELRDRDLGGVIVGPANWQNRKQGAALVAEIRRLAEAEGEAPTLLVAAHEGGPYRSFADLPPDARQADFAEAPSRGVRAWSEASGAALASAGFDLNLFPVADVATVDSPVGDRAFSEDPAVVTAHTTAALAGCERAGIACAPLHFPGLGGASEDPLVGPSTVSLDTGTLEVRDLGPFRAAFDAGAPAVVLSLAFYPAFDAVTPAALEPAIATELLRDELGFEGVAITDDLGAGAIKATSSVRAAAVAALAAGADLLQIPSPADHDGVRDVLVEAVESGQIPLERLREAAARVRALARVARSG